MSKLDKIGCRVHLNPNGSDLRCGDKINAWNWNPNEGVVQLCKMCSLEKQNAFLMGKVLRITDAMEYAAGQPARGGKP